MLQAKRQVSEMMVFGDRAASAQVPTVCTRPRRPFSGEPGRRS